MCLAYLAFTSVANMYKSTSTIPCFIILLLSQRRTSTLLSACVLRPCVRIASTHLTSPITFLQHLPYTIHPPFHLYQGARVVPLLPISPHFKEDPTILESASHIKNITWKLRPFGLDSSPRVNCGAEPLSTGTLVETAHSTRGCWGRQEQVRLFL